MANYKGKIDIANWRSKGNYNFFEWITVICYCCYPKIGEERYTGKINFYLHIIATLDFNLGEKPQILKIQNLTSLPIWIQ